MRSKTLISFAAAALLGMSACGDAADDGGALEECTPENADVLEDNVEGEDLVLSRCTLVTKNITVYGGGAVTVEPGSTVIFGEKAGFWMQANSTFNAVGTADEPILLTGAEERPGFWGNLDFDSTSGADNVLEHVTIEYAGFDEKAAVGTRGTSTVTVQNSTIRNSLGAGFEFKQDTDLIAFEENVVTGNALAGKVGPIVAGSIGASNDLSGNTEDWIVIEDGGAATEVDQSVTYQNIGIPYYFTQSFKIFDDATWTAESGVEILIAANRGIVVGHDGNIVVNGTEDAPVVIRGMESAPGFWNSVDIGPTPSPSNILAHVVIADAGGGGDESAAAVSLQSGRDKTMRLTFDQVTIRDSAGHGVYADSGYQGAFAVSGCDTITFEGLAGDEFAGDPICQ